MVRNLLTALVFGAALSAGCSDKKKDKQGGADGDSHDHGPGPHSGLILEFEGAKFHGEFKPDHAKKEATVWILDGKAVKPYRVKADKVRLVITNTDPKIEIDLLPTDAADGTASTFVGAHDGLAKEMEYKGVVTIVVDGKGFSADVDEKPAKK